MFHHVLVGYDGSAHGKKALEYGIDFAMHAGAELTIVTVFPRVPEYLGSPQREEVAARLEGEGQPMGARPGAPPRPCQRKRSNGSWPGSGPFASRARSSWWIRRPPSSSPTSRRRGFW